MKILASHKIKELDEYTIQHEPILDINLMERAAKACTKVLTNRIKKNQTINVFCGPGNNGGDGLAIARMLSQKNYKISVYLFTEKLSPNGLINLDRLKSEKNVSISILKSKNDFPEISNNSVIIDALFGSGLTREISDFPAELIKFINSQRKSFIVSIDIPSGFFAEDNSSLNFDDDIGYYPQAIKANLTLTLELPFLSFMFPDSDKNVGKWKVIPIGLHHEFLRKLECDTHYIDRKRISKGLKKRNKFSHKGTYGHALLLAGCYGRMGAAVLASKACLRAGVGLLTTHVPRYGYEIMQSSIPEAMISIDSSDILISETPPLEKYNAIGIGPSVGQKENSRKAICKLLDESKVPIVIDADALNIMAAHPEMLENLPKNTILTPHPLEFERLAGKSTNFFERFQKQKAFAKKYNCIVVLKGAHTCTCTPNGKAYFNSTGNPGMGTAGSGDVLTGIILALLAQKHEAKDAAILGVFIHGLAADIALSRESEESIIASDIVKNLGKAFKELYY